VGFTKHAHEDRQSIRCRFANSLRGFKHGRLQDSFGDRRSECRCEDAATSIMYPSLPRLNVQRSDRSSRCFFFWGGRRPGNASCTVTLVRRVWDSVRLAVGNCRPLDNLPPDLPIPTRSSRWLGACAWRLWYFRHSPTLSPGYVTGVAAKMSDPLSSWDSSAPRSLSRRHLQPLLTHSQRRGICGVSVRWPRSPRNSNRRRVQS